MGALLRRLQKEGSTVTADMLEPELISDPATYENVCALQRRIRDLETELRDVQARVARAEMRADGYIPGEYHHPNALVHGTDIEVQLAREARCDSCGQVGMRRDYWHHPITRSSRAFLVCPQCGAREEF